MVFVTRATDFACTNSAFVRESPSITDDQRLRDRFAHAALVIARPGQELNVHGWLEFARPVTFVISKGHRHHRLALASTASVVNRAGGYAGSVFGRFDEDEIYAAARNGDDRLFGPVLYDVTMSFIEREVRFVAIVASGEVDACDHLCGSLAVAAARIAGRKMGRAVETFAIAAPPSRMEDAGQTLDDTLSLRLDDGALARKVRAARAYPLLDNDVERALVARGPEALRVEGFRRILEVPAVPRVRRVPEVPGVPRVLRVRKGRRDQSRSAAQSVARSD